MLCEHPTCSHQADSICKSHCHLSVCEKHRLEHEKNLLNEFEKQLDVFSGSISSLLEQTRFKLKQSKEHQQSELSSIDTLFNQHLVTIDQRLKFTKSTKEFLQKKRQDLIEYRNGNQQLSRDDYQQVEDLSSDIQTHLQQQYQSNNQVLDRNNQISSWTNETLLEKTSTSSEIDCIQLSGSEDESIDHVMENDPSTSSGTVDTNSSLLIRIPKSRARGRAFHLSAVRDLCPLTELGVYGLKSSHDMTRFCSKTHNQKRGLYMHFIYYHSIKSSIAYQLAKALAKGLKPNETIVFPQDTTSIVLESIRCPFDETARKFTRKNSIPHTPCGVSVNHRYFKTHLRGRHSITRLNADLIFRAMVDHGTISHVQFEEDLCENE